MLLRRRPLVQVLETQDRQQYNESERVRGDVESEFNQAVYRDAEDTDDCATRDDTLNPVGRCQGLPALLDQREGKPDKYGRSN